ncbi:sensor histidine kinase [Undibacterium sp. Di24W]|uniref:sensor histidine kinase n=1 Tax=Undibacterium sp. Di24W TaxID=3413033 RepID=UPI003BF4572B
MINIDVNLNKATNKRILLVDDDQALCSFIGLQLARFGHDLIATADSGEDAILIASRIHPDLIIMDIHLNGEMDGIAAANAIHAVSDIPIVFLTALCTDDLLHRAKTADTFAYVLKPINERELRVVIEMAFYKHEVQAKLKRSQSFNRSILNSVNAEIAVIDADGVIIAVNRAWRDFANCESASACSEEMIATNYGVGTNYLSVCPSEKGGGEGAENNVRKGIQSVLDRSLSSFDLEYPCHSPQKKRWFHMSVTPFENGEGGAVISHMDISARKQVEADLRVALQEKNVLIKEVHHRVKNNLQVVTSLLRLEAARAHKNEAKTVLDNMQNRIQTLALMHEFLYRQSQFSSVDLSSYLRELSVLSFRTMHQEKDMVSLAFDLNGFLVTIDQATCCGLIVNELISNSLKHAFPGGRTGQISVRLRTTDIQDQLLLSVHDNGVGLSPDFAEKRQHALGLELVTSLAQQIGGELQIEQSVGLSFSVCFIASLDVRELQSA